MSSRRKGFEEKGLFDHFHTWVVLSGTVPSQSSPSRASISSNKGLIKRINDVLRLSFKIKFWKNRIPFKCIVNHNHFVIPINFKLCIKWRIKWNVGFVLSLEYKLISIKYYNNKYYTLLYQLNDTVSIQYNKLFTLQYLLYIYYYT